MQSRDFIAIVDWFIKSCVSSWDKYSRTCRVDHSWCWVKWREDRTGWSSCRCVVVVVIWSSCFVGCFGVLLFAFGLAILAFLEFDHFYKFNLKKLMNFMNNMNQINSKFPLLTFPRFSFQVFIGSFFVKSLVYLEIEKADCTENALPTGGGSGKYLRNLCRKFVASRVWGWGSLYRDPILTQI